VIGVDAEYAETPDKKIQALIRFDDNNDIKGFVEGLAVTKGLMARFDGEFSKHSRESVGRVLNVIQAAAKTARA
jgi:hypothetical protein